MEQEYCKQHSAHGVKIGINEKRIVALETKLWFIILLLFTNLGGIIGVLLKT